MNPIALRRHPLKFYFLIFFLALFCCALGALILWVGLRSAERRENGAFTMSAFSLFFILLGIFSLYKYFRNTPIAKTDQYQITFNDTEAFKWEDLEKVTLTGKQPFKYLFSYQMEGMMLLFKNGKVKYLFDDFYVNLGEMKSFIQQIVIDKNATFQYAPESLQNSNSIPETFAAYKGNQFTSLRGLMLWSLYLIIIIMFVLRPGYLDNINIPKFVLSFGLFCLGWFYLHSLLMNYFLISEHYLEVKNHNLSWRKKLYVLDDIKEVAIETQGKMPNSLRIITKDFRSKVFPAGTLNGRNWRALKEKLESKSIPVRIDSPFLSI
jgi:hypothetical protein